MATVDIRAKQGIVPVMPREYSKSIGAALGVHPITVRKWKMKGVLDIKLAEHSRLIAKRAERLAAIQERNRRAGQ